MSTNEPSNTGLDGLEHLVKCLRQYSRSDANARQRRRISERQIVEALESAGNFLSIVGGGSIAGVASGAYRPGNREEVESSTNLLRVLDQHMENVAQIHRMMVDAIRARADELGLLPPEI
ncbi:MAG: hypothetical protein ACYDHY_14990 [Acidiferrobacterales bacterium]